METCLKTIILDIPSFGICTLLNLSCLPEKFRSYEKIAKTAQGMELQELPVLSLKNIEEIFKTVVGKLSENNIAITTGITIWLSGVHESYPLLNVGDKDQEPDKSIHVIEIFILEEIKKNKKGKVTGFVNKTLEEILISQVEESRGDDIMYCLFLGDSE